MFCKIVPFRIRNYDWLGLQYNFRLYKRKQKKRLQLRPLVPPSQSENFRFWVKNFMGEETLCMYLLAGRWFISPFLVTRCVAFLSNLQQLSSKIACFLPDAKNIVRKFRLYLKAIIMQTGYKKLHMQVVSKQCFVSLFLSKTCSMQVNERMHGWTKMSTFQLQVIRKICVAQVRKMWINKDWNAL